MPNLTNESIEKISAENEQFLEKGNVSRKEVIKLKLNIENALIEWKCALGTEAELLVSRTKLPGRRTITIRCKGEPCNPFSGSKNDGWESWMGKFADTLLNPPVYEYSDGENKISFSGNRQKKSMIVLILLSIVAGIVLGVSGDLFLSDNLRADICTVFLEPFYTTFIGLFGLCGIPLIFLSVMNGIIGVGNIRTFSEIGTKMIKVFTRFIFVLAIVAAIIGFVIIDPAITKHWTAVIYSDLVSLFLSIFPSGLLQPLINSNAIQLIILGLGFAIAILLMDKTDCALSKCMVNLQEVMLMFSLWVADFIPLFITVGLVNMLWGKAFTSLLPIVNLFAATVILSAVMIAGFVGYIAIRHKVRVRTILGKISKTFLIALGTGSCAASIPENYSCCAGKLGISNKLFSFGIPVGTTIFKPATVIRLVLLCLYMTGINGMSISFSWLLVLIFLSICVSVACPAIPGGVLMFCGILFSNLGIPSDSIDLMLATDVLFDSVCTAVNQIAVSLMLTIYAGKADLLDSEVLRTDRQQLQ